MDTHNTIVNTCMYMQSNTVGMYRRLVQLVTAYVLDTVSARVSESVAKYQHVFAEAVGCCV